MIERLSGSADKQYALNRGEVLNPVTDMIGYGTHNQPAGTWSDDSSMEIVTMEWLSESGVSWDGIDSPLGIGFLVFLFVRWTTT